MNPSASVGGFALCNNRYMDSALHLMTLGVLFLTAVMLVAGSASYVLDSVTWQKNPEKMGSLNHTPSWDIQGAVVPRHAKCHTCEVQVIKSGGVLVGASSME